MRLRSVHALMGIVAVGLGGLVWYQTPRESATAKTSIPARDAERDDDAALARYKLNRELQRLRGDVRALQQSPVDEPVARPREAAEAGPEPSPAAGPQPRTEEQVDRALHSALRTEPRDPEWSASTEQSIHALFSEGRFPGATLVAADCRNTLCRVVVSQKDEASFEAFRETLPQTPPFDTQGFVRNQGTDTDPELVIYFARPGERLDALLAKS